MYTKPVSSIIRAHGLNYHIYADDMQIYNSAAPSEISSLVMSMQWFVKEIGVWMLSSVLPENNVAVSQDIKESLARCYAFLGNHIEALKVSRDLVKEMSVEDEARQRQSLMVHAFVCEKACLWNECVKTLQRLCLLQPNFPQTWYHLGEAMLKLTLVPETSGDLKPMTDDSQTDPHNSPKTTSPSDNSKDKDENKKMQLLIIMMCYNQAKVFLESVLRNASDIIKVRNQRLIAEISVKIKDLPLPEELKQKVSNSKVGTTEDYAEHQTKLLENEDTSHLFYQRFCKWLQTICTQ
ncbi:zinc fingers and homeoboxes protein 1, isoform 2 [Elysia marginata]|uniref:Zinc fingers and homeoboxes protein 1, isoform 2 n=1 Tax=Elysia marginata TaxID=1093978 RepID=A0AAV4HPK3_9GAST|nr:zinc fingers and homeoboxes protein 1, isoform 2 [Elysia marginata]